MDPAIETAAPAQPAPVTEISATRDAANKGSFADFDKADQAVRAGKPLPAVEVEAPPVAPVAPATPQLSRKEREQEATNERIRIAVEKATADLRSQLATFRAPRTDAPAQPAAPAAPAQPETKTAEYKRLMALPDAPKLADFDSVEEHTAAMATFIADTRHEERIIADRQRAEQQSEETYHRDSVKAFDDRVNAIAATEPDIVAKILPVAQSLGSAAVKGGPARTLSNMVRASEVGPQILRHFADHPDVMPLLINGPDALRALPHESRMAAHLRYMVTELSKIEGSFAPPIPPAAPDVPAAAPLETITKAPDPAPILTKAGSIADPRKAALSRGDFATFDKLEMQDRQARLRHA